MPYIHDCSCAQMTSMCRALIYINEEKAIFKTPNGDLEVKAASNLEETLGQAKAALVCY